MANFNLMRRLTTRNPTKIVLLIMDGLGGLPIQPNGPTELEAAHTPHMDALATAGTLGRIVPVRPGITPGSGPAHLALFGYDPITYNIGRGVLEAFGVGVPVGTQDVAARANFCTLDTDGNISDRRAGRIASADAIPLIEKLQQISLPGVQTEVKHVKEYRFVLVLRGEGLGSNLPDTDPQATGIPPLTAQGSDSDSQKTASLVNRWLAEAREVLKNDAPANFLTLRGFSSDPDLPKYADVYKLKAACIAVYPMYKGVSRLVGMDVQTFAGDQPADQFAALAQHWSDYDFFFVHVKRTDSMGEDGNFDGKIGIIESVDAALPQLLDLKPDVLAITGDHSTPARMRSHSWHPVPLLLHAPATHLPDRQTAFGERACMAGGLGTFPSTDLMPLMLAHAGRLVKYGA